MPTSDWKTRTNRINSEKSTGPRSEAGKKRSRENALTHGLSGEGIVLPDRELEEIARQREVWGAYYQVDTPIKKWALEELVVNLVRIEACQKHQTAVRQLEAAAETVWEIDRQAEAAVLGDKLAKKPEVVALQLRQSKYGCEWLMEQWCALGLALESAPWTDAQFQRALDLHGLRHDQRATAIPDDPAAFADAEYLRLEALLANGLDAFDEMERICTIDESPFALSKKIALLQRYEAACVKRLHDAVKLLEKKTVEVSAKPEPVEKPAPEPDLYALYKKDAEAWAEFNRQWDAAKSDEERAALKPDIPGLVAPAVRASIPSTLPKPSLSAAVPSANFGPPMNRKQRKAMAKLNAKGK